MFDVKYLLYFFLIQLIIATPQLNLYYTDGVSEIYNDLQHNCLHMAIDEWRKMSYREIVSYCISELPSKFNIENNDFFSNLTFDELSKQNITSQQLYLWSAPIDIIEDYQFYLNQLSTENDSSLGKEIFYNCTLLRFGPICQYQLHYHYPRHSSLYEIIDDFYRVHQYNPTTLTCYTHLKCNRGPYPSCLDWTEICDGKIDCLDGGFDEEHCWQLEINQCKDDEFQCRNGQCISKSFYRDDKSFPDCVDISDILRLVGTQLIINCVGYDKLSFKCEDISSQTYYHTSSCAKNRQQLLIEAMYSSTDSLVSEKCWTAFNCLIHLEKSEYASCDERCKYDKCMKNIENTCPDMLFFPSVPILFGNIYIAYRKNDLQYWSGLSNVTFYICYDTFQYDAFFVNFSKIFFNNITCVNSKQFVGSLIYQIKSVKEVNTVSISELYEFLKRYHLSFNYTSAICTRSNMYQCVRSSKCISIYRLMDNVIDCPHMDDENIDIDNDTDRMEHFKKTHFKCPISGKYIHQFYVNDGECQCESTLQMGCEDENLENNNFKRNIIFQHICDGFIDLSPTMIGERNETDESECEQWQCNNTYTRCNKVWNCPNGVDEIGCVSYSTLNCSSKHHVCVLPDTNQLACLPIEKANDGHVDCLGGTDEPTLCESYIKYPSITVPSFYCMNQNSKSCIRINDLCDKRNNCEHVDDERFCANYSIPLPFNFFCDVYSWNSDFVKFFCDYFLTKKSHEIIYFKLHGMINLDKSMVKNMKNPIYSDSSMIEISDQHQPRCHRGIDLLVWLSNKNNLTKNTCLCPPNFYGNQCQYQNQRISFITKFRALSSSLKIPFSIVISLIDDSDKRLIHSYEQLTYLSVRDCKIKFHSYLVYSTRPKDPTKNYSIHIDIYEKFSLKYRGSLLFPVSFSFLPVHRLAFIIDIPRSDDKTQSCSNRKCIHGKCIKYSNNPEIVSFCQCDHGWSGKFCTIQHTCRCASDSLCIGISANNRSICICKINKFGSRCLLIDTICQTNNKSTCQNDGQCISNIDYKLSNEDFFCICPKGFNGIRCEIADNKLVLSFEKDIVLSKEIYIHFIDIISLRVSEEFAGRATTFRRIPIQEDSIIVYWSQQFHLVFTETSNKTYYLTVVQNSYNQSTTIIKTINSFDRCPHIGELFNESFVKLDLIRRIKYYHLPCQRESLNLSCFYDEVHFCLCYQFGEQRLANCFKFDHDMTFDCSGQNECENGAKCLQDKSNCPTTSLCNCRPCFYGIICQFSTNGFDLSLDAILSYHILPNVSLNFQPSIIKFSLAFTIIFVITGFLSGVLSVITFKNKIILEVGCGLYLLGSSIITLLTMIMFGLKFLILLFAQMGIILDRSFLLFQCHSFDFVLRVCLCMNQWLDACVALERVMTIRKGPNFVKKKSRQTAKLVILILLIVIVGTSIHDPIYRRLIDEENNDNNEKRTWCIVTYPFILEVYNKTIHIFHLFGPFMMNFISSIILIKTKSYQQANIHKRPYKIILREQFRQHKNLLIVPIILVILAIPRIIIIFLSKCLESANDSWLFLCGYFISFIPPMSTLFIFVLPSKFFRKELNKTLSYYRTCIQRYLYRNT